MKITLQKREITGKKVSRLRKQGIVPAVCYGAGEPVMPCSVNAKELFRALHSGEVVFETEGDIAGKQVLVQDITHDAVTEQPLHIDFLFIDATHEVEYEVPVHIEGEAPAVKLLGGQMLMPLDKVAVRALPQNLPNQVVVDVSGLAEIGSHITAGGVSLPDTVSLVTNPEDILVSIVEQVAEVEDDTGPDMENIEATAEGEKKKDDASDESNT